MRILDGKSGALSDRSDVIVRGNIIERIDTAPIAAESGVAVIDGGHVIANDEPSRLKAQMGDTVVEMSFPDEGFAERAVGLLGGDSLGKVEREHRTVRVSSNKGARVLVEVLRRFDADGVEPSTLTVREPSLDDVFLELTGHRAEASEPDQPAEGGAA